MPRRGRSNYQPLDRGYVYCRANWHKEIFHVDCLTGGAQHDIGFRRRISVKSARNTSSGPNIGQHPRVLIGRIRFWVLVANALAQVDGGSTQHGSSHSPERAAMRCRN